MDEGAVAVRQPPVDPGIPGAAQVDGGDLVEARAAGPAADRLNGRTPSMVRRQEVAERGVRSAGGGQCLRLGEQAINCAAELSVGLFTQLRLVRLFRSEEHTSELQSLMRISYAVFCLKKK